MRNLFYISSVLFLLFSCANEKNVLYLNDLPRNTEIKNANQYTQKLQAGDILTIQIATPDNVGIQPFNISNQNADVAEVGSNNSSLILHTIKPDGTIEYPILGKLKIAGLSVQETHDLLQSKLKIYLKNPFVHIEWINFKFTVLGQVNKPGTYKVQGERTTFFEALGMAGDLDIYGNRKDILLIREQNGMQKYISIDLTKKDILNSEAYFIKQNDVIIVSPNPSQVQASSFNRNIPTYISVSSVIISLISLFVFISNN